MKQNVPVVLFLHQVAVVLCRLFPAQPASARFSFYKIAFFFLCFFCVSFSGYSQYEREWVKSFERTVPPRFMKIDHEKNLVTLGDNSIKRYDFNGNELWQERYVGTENKFVIDVQNNIYILSFLPRNTTERETFITKYTADGQQAWVFQYMPSDHTFNTSDLDVNAGGEVFLTGTAVSGDTRHVKTMKLNASGTAFIWEKEYNGFSKMTPSAVGVRVGKEGNVYVLGSDAVAKEGFAPGVQESKPFLLKYSGADGNLLLEKDYKAEIDNSTIPQHYSYHNMGLDKEGNMYVVAHRMSQSFPGFSHFVFKLNAAGDFQWRTDVSERRIELWASSIDEDGNVVMRSTYQSIQGPPLTLVSRISSEGQFSWSKSFYDGEEIAEVNNAGVGAVLALPGGLTAIGGNIRNSPEGNQDLFLMVLDGGGESVFMDRYELNESSDGVRSMAADAAGNIFVGGYALLGSPISDMLLIKYSTEGVQEEPEKVRVKLSLPPYAMKVGEQVRTTATFRDLTLNKDTGVRWDWGDNEKSMSFTEFGSPRITGEHRYKEAGIYQVGLDFEESGLMPESDEYKEWMVIFDPKAGSVLGGGLIASPQTSLRLMQKEGRVAYTFLLDYRETHHAAKPTGALVLAFEDRNIFWSSSPVWLVVKENQAVWHGTGKLNGKGNYGYTAAAYDAKGAGLNDPNDRLRILIWDMDAGNRVVYDNFNQQEDIMDMRQQAPLIGAGQVIIGGGQLPTDLFAFNPEVMLEDKMQVEVYPTQFRDNATLNFTLMKGGAYNISIYDMKGMVVQQVKQGYAEPLKQNEIALNGSGLRPGIYIARVVSEGDAKTVRLVIDK